MSIEYAEDCSVFKCTKCGKLIIIEMDEQPPEICEACQNKENRITFEYLKWIDDNRKYSSGMNGKSGKWILFNVAYDGLVSKDQKEKYLLTCFLPGMKSNLGYFLKQNEATKRAEIVLKYWINNLGKELFGGEQ